MMVRGSRIALLLAWTVGAGAAYAASGDASVDFQKSVTLTPQEAAAQTKEYYKRMQEAEKHILLMQSKAKRDKDMVKLNCVGDKLSQVRGHLTVADQSVKAINSAADRNDDGARQHEFTRMTILFQKVQTLDQEAQQCIGEDVSYVGATTTSVEIDPSVPPGDPTQPEIPLPEPTRPPEASPFV